ncbi:hypothetical protein AB0B78_16700 [Streptomyces sp. NPDC040724]|uniref:hypothetical protein n=1 Tax=Streptomyces sp. NPDC040724 TaxID=3155612 RepID=UPI0034102A4F
MTTGPAARGAPPEARGAPPEARAATAPGPAVAGPGGEVRGRFAAGPAHRHPPGVDVGRIRTARRARGLRAGGPVTGRPGGPAAVFAVAPRRAAGPDLPAGGSVGVAGESAAAGSVGLALPMASGTLRRAAVPYLPPGGSGAVVEAWIAAGSGALAQPVACGRVVA